ncbi:MAG TPA: c-type cytochrome domain-containing protein, partial [Planctomycetota bacterium]|nr:c-type cytochrome domain-containing protein [Planctomycetota bacterium]
MTLLVCLALAQDVDFDREVRPILEKRCLACHGTEKRKGGLLLTARSHALLRGDSGEPAIVPGEPEKSELLKRVRPTAEDRMPPKGEPLSDADLALLRRWIAQGAVWPDRDGPARHWSYVPPVRPEPPSVR